jgi:predicted DCC family thiol-disulfide oxidoreductase YuxK
MKEVLWLDGEGRVEGGVQAIAAALKAAGRPWLGWFVKRIPGSAFIYQAIARNRSTSCRAVPGQSLAPPRGPEPTHRVQN